MTIPSLSGIETALSGLEAEQTELDTTGNNIDNASTPGYTEEVVNLAPSTPTEISSESADGASFTQLGSGIDVESITRVRNEFLDAQYRAQNTLLGHATTTAAQLGNAQSALGESGGTTPVATALSQFWSDWNSLADNPSSAAAAQALVDDGTTLAQTLQSLSSSLSSLQTQAAAQGAAIIAPNGELGQDVNQIASLNTAISDAINAGQDPNTLEDERDNALDDLSSLGNISVTADADNPNMVDVALGGAEVVGGAGADMPAGLWVGVGGELGALALQSSTSTNATGTIQSYINSLNTIASDLVSTVNGALPPGTPFFSARGTTAATITVTATPTTATTFGNSDANSVADLQGGSADLAYAALVGQIGDDVQSAQRTQTTQQAVVTATQNQRESISGVSLDQEMTNLVSEQRGYQASAQTLNTLSSVLETLLSAVGSVGM